MATPSSRRALSRKLCRGVLTGMGVGSVTAALAVAYAWREAHDFQLEHRYLPILPEGAPSFRLLHISDFHITPTQAAKRRFIQSLAKLEPDFVAVTGDFLGDRLAVPSALDALGDLRDSPGAFVFGSNDYFAPAPFNPARYLWRTTEADERPQLDQLRDLTVTQDQAGARQWSLGPGRLPWADLVAGLTSFGWFNLNNHNHLLTLSGLTVALRGVNDPHIELDDYPAVAGTYPHKAQLRLGLTHAPYRRIIEAMAQDHTDLLLAGHTHGGQIRAPFFGTLVTNSDIPREQARGLSSHSRPGSDHPMLLHVSQGIGTSPYAQIRALCPPMATLFTLGPRSDLATAPAA